MTRRQSVILWSATVLILLGVAFWGAVLYLTRSTYGEDQIRAVVMNMIEGKTKGHIYVGRISGGFFSGVTIDSLEIRDDEDSLFIRTGPIRASYDLRDLVDRRVLLKYVSVTRPTVYIRQHQTGEWNWRRIFPEQPKGPPRANRGLGDFVVIESGRIKDATFTLTLPWHPSRLLRGAQRDSAIRFELARKDHEIRRVRGGFARTWRWTKGQADIGYIRIADPDSIGRLFTVKSLAADEADPPFKFNNVKGTVRHLGDSVWLKLSHFDLPGSTGSANGKLVWGSDLPMRYNVHVVGDSVSLRDVAWIYPTLPTTGSGKMELDIRSERDPHIVDYIITKMDVRSNRSRLLGNMTYAVGGPMLVVKDVELRGAPVNFDLLRTLNGKPFPYNWQGNITGTVRASGGPLTNFKVEDVQATFEDTNVPGAISRASGRGELNIFQPAFTEFHNFFVDASQVDLRTLQYLNPEFLQLRGTVSGVATLDSSWLDVRFKDADITHHDGEGVESRATGKGRVTWGERYMTYDMDMHLSPLSFTQLARSYPNLTLRGPYTGPLKVQGTAEDLAVTTTLTGAAGTISFNGRVDSDPPQYFARGEGTLTQVDLRGLMESDSFPRSKLNGRFNVQLGGDSAATMAGTVRVALGKSAIDTLALDTAAAELHLAHGVATFEDALVTLPGARGVLSGRFGYLGGNQNVSLEYDVRVDSIGSFRSYLARTFRPRGRDTVFTGGIRAHGTYSGTRDQFAVAGRVTGTKIRINEQSAAKVVGEYTISGTHGSPSGKISLALDSLVAGALRLNRVNLTYDGSVKDGGSFATTIVGEKGQTAILNGKAAFRGDTTVVDLDSTVVTMDTTRRFKSSAPSRVVIAPGVTTLDSIIFPLGAFQAAGKSARVAIRDARISGNDISAWVNADSVDFGLLTSLAPSVGKATGTVSANVNIRGTTERPNLVGFVSLRNGSFAPTNTGVTYDRLTARLRLAGDTIHIDTLRAENDRKKQRGSISFSGFLRLQPNNEISLSLNAQARNFHAIHRVGLASLFVTTTDTLRLRGDSRAATLTGSVRVDQGLIYLPEVRKNLIDLDDPLFAEFRDTARAAVSLPRSRSTLMNNLTLSGVTLSFPEESQVWLRSSVANIKLGGSLRVTTVQPYGTGSQLTLDGTLTADRGYYQYELGPIRPSFTVESGRLRFYPTGEIDPELDIKAIHTVRAPQRSTTRQDVRIRVSLTGPLSRMKVDVGSADTTFSQADAIAYLLYGGPSTEIVNATSGQYTDYVLTAGSRFVTGALGSRVSGGLKLDVFELQAANINTSSFGLTNPNAYLYGLYNTRVMLAKQINSRTFLGLSTGLCRVNFSRNFGLQLEYRLSNLYTLQGGMEPGSSDLTCSIGGSSGLQQTPPQLGFDLFRTWRF
jgi:hypothetical protein